MIEGRVAAAALLDDVFVVGRLGRPPSADNEFCRVRLGRAVPPLLLALLLRRRTRSLGDTPSSMSRVGVVLRDDAPENEPDRDEVLFRRLCSFSIRSWLRWL